MTKPLTIWSLENQLRTIGNGAAVSIWNDTFDINLMGSALTGGERRILGSGNTIETALTNAYKRIEELKKMGAWPLRLE